MIRRAATSSALVALALTVACAPRPRLNLPTGPGEPFSEAAPLVERTLAHCAGLRTLTAEIRLSGRAGRQKLRARLIAGFAAPESVRLEAVAPFGAPGFILAADAAHATLLLPRDGRVLTGAPPARILEALAGLSVTADALRMLLAGCPSGSVAIEQARQYGTQWTVLETGDAGTLYFRAIAGGWRLAAIARPALIVEYDPHPGEQPTVVRFRDARTGDAASVDLTLSLSQVEVNVLVPDEAFRLVVPPEAVPISLDELREAGPMREAAARNAERGSRR